jgi:hypothetical protein
LSVWLFAKEFGESAMYGAAIVAAATAEDFFRKLRRFSGVSLILIIFEEAGVKERGRTSKRVSLPGCQGRNLKSRCDSRKSLR